MSEPLSLTTELEAVNAILASVGESPITAFDGEFVDAELARNLLRAQMRALQTKGWHWNTDLTMVYALDVNGEIHLPTNILSITLEDPTFTRRGQRLYDRVNHTYVFTTAATATQVVSLLSFDEMPEAARSYCYQRAGRIFQDQMGGDQILHAFQERDERMAWADLSNEEANHSGYNMMTNLSLLTRMKSGR